MEKRYKEDKTPHVLTYNDVVDDVCSFQVRAYIIKHGYDVSEFLESYRMILKQLQEAA